MLTMEVQAAQVYWHMGGGGGGGGSSGSEVYDPLFASSRMVGNIGALDVTTSTWFGDDMRFVHGINM